MKPENWEEIERLYYAALERKTAQRSSYLADAAGGNDSLRAEVESLLLHREQRGNFLDSPGIDIVKPELVQNGQAYVDTKAQPKSAPWWMFAIAAIFLVCAAVRYYAYFVQPEMLWGDLRWGYVRDERGTIIGLDIQKVASGSSAASAGLEPGDIILERDSDGLISPNVYEGRKYWQTGHTYRIKIQRKGEIKVLYLTLRRYSLRDWVNLNPLLKTTLYLFLAAAIAFARPHDLSARWGALFLATFAIVNFYGANPPFGVHGWKRTILQFPHLIGWLTALLPSLCSAIWLPVGLTFFAVFPRNLFQRRWHWALIWIYAVFFVPLVIFYDQYPIFSLPKWWPGWYENLFRLLGTVGCSAIVVIAILNYRRLRDLNKRRRFRIVLTGLAITAIGVLPNASYSSGLVFKWQFLGRLLGGMPKILWRIIGCLNWAFPIAMTYAILRHRMFDIRVAIRLGLRYVAARGALVSLVPIVVVVLAADMLFHGNQPLVQILQQRALFYAVLAGAGLLLHFRRNTWLDALDRRFFREHYNAQQILRAIVEELRAVRDLERMAPHVVSKIYAALHPEFATILVRRPGDAEFQTTATTSKAFPPIPANTKLITLVRVLGKPVEISQAQTSWLQKHLPSDEIFFLSRMHLEWIFPICVTEGRTEALLALGPKRSEEPYSQEDQELLQGVTSSLALLLEESPVTASEGFEECPQCGNCYDSGSGRCNREGTELTPLPFPRMLAQRYRFERRLGEGGMGFVYEALDTELDRPVAAKMMHPDLAVHTDMLERFKREAKAAASLAHPNIVTVYDYGVTRDRRAYLIMELLHGSTLRQELVKSGRLTAARAAEILSGVCVAVNAVHRQGLVHRDLKPENIFIVKNDGIETPKILDFGIVKPIATSDSLVSTGRTSPGILLGTLRYMSPEELRDEKQTEAWDLWALAVVTYEMLTGAHPFAGNSSLEVQHAILSSDMTPLQNHLPDAPAHWQDFFDKALSPHLELRPRDALQLLSYFVEATRY
jgi:eukaryotic-like serine/threonine-protein kinase